MESLNNIIDNKYFSYGFSGLLLVYICFIRVSEKTSKIVNNIIFKLILLALIVFFSTKNILIAILLALVFVVNLIVISSHKFTRETMAAVELVNLKKNKVKTQESNKANIKEEEKKVNKRSIPDKPVTTIKEEDPNNELSLNDDSLSLLH